MIFVAVSISPDLFFLVLLTSAVNESRLVAKGLDQVSILFLIFQVPKKYPFNNLYLERGGDPNKEPPTDEDTDPRKRLIPHTFYGS